MISAAELFTFKIGNSRVVENIFPEKNVEMENYLPE